VAPLFEARLGLFSTLDEDDLLQHPLSACKAVVSNPMPQELLSNPQPILGIGTGLSISRRRAALQACEHYAASIVDRRRLPEREIQQHRLPVDRFFSDMPLAEVNEWVWAVDLHSKLPHLVPAALAYPVLNGLSPEQTPRPGLGSGMSWTEALCRGLMSLCQHLTIARLSDRQKPCLQIDLAMTPLESEGTTQRHALSFILSKTEQSLKVYDVTGPLQVPTLAFCLDDRTIAYTTQCTIAQALREGLETVLVAWQLSEETIVVPSTVVDIPLALRSDDTCAPMYDIPLEWSERLQWLLSALHKMHWNAFAVPLDHDPALCAVQPYIVQLLLGRA